MSRKTISGTTNTVRASVRTASGQPWIVGPASQRISVMLG